MEGHYAQLVVVMATVALVLASANADLFSGLNFCNLNEAQLQACSSPVNNNPTPQCCAAVKGVDPKCVCYLVNSPVISSNKDQAKRMIGGCGIDVARC